jgi:hypothetical protein
VYTVMNLRVPSNEGNFLSSLGHVSFSKKDSAPWSCLVSYSKLTSLLY